MTHRTRMLAVVSGAVVTVVGALVSVIYFFQPWRSCHGEDTSAGCAMLPVDATVMAVAMWSTLVGIVIVFVAVTLRAKNAR